ncbi:ATP12 family protein [Pontixanthobacter aestiaquae]|uniref:Molecular chaperone n=1 Tax=Pontixanthobacter aestiaquae TaxID=1509367 RepID=A0A844Z2H1_9SPHN|nr:ATP12 family protein [Pontixanthobacter aestiaquae]MDN3646107.1 ATP12 family protein [Pontixanthobacter aestiaquae]MXO82901.1 molecular chaperone [Pontixanthobacter aestiaquae]
MKRFYKAVDIEAADNGFRITLDGRGIKTALGKAQILPAQSLADAMAKEWSAQGDEIDPALFRYRDLADYAIDIIAPDRGTTIDKLLSFIETDTLCYRAGPEEPFYAKQQAIWDPLLTKLEAQEGITLERISGIMHKPQSPETHAKLSQRLNGFDDFALASTLTMASLAASLSVALRANASDADVNALWSAANLEEDWQIEQWGQDHDAQEVRKRRTADFLNAYEFGRLAADKT